MNIGPEQNSSMLPSPLSPPPSHYHQALAPSQQAQYPPPPHAPVTMHDIQQLLHSQLQPALQHFTLTSNSLSNNFAALRQTVEASSAESAKATAYSAQAAAEVKQLGEVIQQQAAKIASLEIERVLWQMQTEQDRIQRQEKMNSLFITPSNSSSSPFTATAAGEQAGSIISISNPTNIAKGVEVKFKSKDAANAVQQRFAFPKKATPTTAPFKAIYAKTRVQQQRDRLNSTIKQRLPLGVTGFYKGGQLHISKAPPAEARTSPDAAPYPSWLHVTSGPSGLDMMNYVNLVEVPETAQQVLAMQQHHARNVQHTHARSPPRSPAQPLNLAASLNDHDMPAAHNKRDGHTPPSVQRPNKMSTGSVNRE